DLPNGRQKRPSGESSPGDLRPDLLDKLPVNRHAGVRKNLDGDARPHVYHCNNTHVRWRVKPAVKKFSVLIPTRRLRHSAPPMRYTLRVSAACALAFSAASALAQTGPALLLKPNLSETEALEARGDAIFLQQGSTSNAGADFRLSVFE